MLTIEERFRADGALSSGKRCTVFHFFPENSATAKECVIVFSRSFCRISANRRHCIRFCGSATNAAPRSEYLSGELYNAHTSSTPLFERFTRLRLEFCESTTSSASLSAAHRSDQMIGVFFAPLKSWSWGIRFSSLIVTNDWVDSIITKHARKECTAVEGYIT